MQQDRLALGQDLSDFALRLLTGGFLMHETWDNIVSNARMAEFAAFMAQAGFPVPQRLAPVSVAVQFGAGFLLALGLMTRWSGLLIAVNFIVAIAMVHWSETFRQWWPAIVLVALGLHFLANGAGRISLDAWRKDNRG